MVLSAFRELVGRPAPQFERLADAELLVVDVGASGAIGDAGAATAEAEAVFVKAVTAALARHMEVLFRPEEAAG